MYVIVLYYLQPSELKSILRSSTSWKENVDCAFGPYVNMIFVWAEINVLAWSGFGEGPSPGSQTSALLLYLHKAREGRSSLCISYKNTQPIHEGSAFMT